MQWNRKGKLEVTKEPVSAGKMGDAHIVKAMERTEKERRRKGYKENMCLQYWAMTFFSGSLHEQIDFLPVVAYYKSREYFGE